VVVRVRYERNSERVDSTNNGKFIITHMTCSSKLMHAAHPSSDGDAMSVRMVIKIAWPNQQ